MKKKKPTKGAPALKGSPMAMVKAQQEADAAYNAAMEEYNAQVAEAKEALSAWSGIYALMNERKRSAEPQQPAVTESEPAKHEEMPQAEEPKDNAEVVDTTPTISNAINTLYSKGKDFASKVFSRTFFDFAKTPAFMHQLGITGSKFTIRYGVIARHFGKDGSHDFTQSEWEQIPNAIERPFAIARLTGKDKGYRIYTSLKTEKGEYVVVGVDVKNAGRDMEVNAISTLFGRRNGANIPTNEEIIYRSETITPEQEALLGRPNSDQYPTEQELSAGKDINKQTTLQENGGGKIF